MEVEAVKQEEIRWVLNNLTVEQKGIIEFYCDNDSKELRKIGYETWQNLGVPQSDYDDLCDDAVKVLIETIAFYDPKRKAKFHTYLTGNIQRSAKDWYRDHYLRAKRNHLLIKDGKIIKDDNGNPVIITQISLDIENDDGIGLKDIIPDPRTLEDYFFDTEQLEHNSRLELYLAKLTLEQRRVAKLLIACYEPKEIKEILHLSNKKWHDIIQGLGSYEYIKILHS